jgi:hypothetical protein
MKNNETCIHGGVSPISLLAELHHSQAGSGRHRCPICAYDYGLLVRFLRGQVGNDWDHVYSEIISRIPSKLLVYKEMIFWFVAEKVEIKDGKPWDKKAQQYIWTGGELKDVHFTETKTQPKLIEFYVDPNTNKLVRIEQKAFKRILKKKD